MSDIPQLVNLLEAVRQELWRGVGRLEAAVEAERVRDEALALNVETVARSAHDLGGADLGGSGTGTNVLWDCKGDGCVWVGSGGDGWGGDRRPEVCGAAAGTAT